MESLTSLKKELNGLERSDLINLCARLARHKKENKELLAYLLLDADDPILYAEKIKPSLEVPYESNFYSVWAFIKQLRKALRQITKYRRFTLSDRGEAELLLHFIRQLYAHWRPEFCHTSIQKIVQRCEEKIAQLIEKMDEDFQSDYAEPLQELRSESLRRFK